MKNIYCSNRLIFSLTLGVTLLMTACGTTTSSYSGCGVLFNYPASFQQNAAVQVEKLRAMPDMKEVSVLIEHYHATRDSIRICQNSK